VWHFVDPDACDAPNAPDAPNALDTPHLLSVELTELLTINQIIERNTPLAMWDADERPEAEEGARPRAPRPAKFDNIKEEYLLRELGRGDS